MSMSKKQKNNSGLVYSTNPDFKLPNPDNEQTDALQPKQQNLRIWLEKNHRGGKEVSVIRDFIGTEDEMEILCKELKTKCGTGGSVKFGEIIIQGDQRKKMGEILTKLGYKFKMAGG